MTENYELNNGHIHEAIDRLDVSINYLHSALLEHALINSVETFDMEVQAAIEILANLYQKIGAYDSVLEISTEYGLKEEYIITPA